MPLSYNDEKRHSKNRRWLYKLGQIMRKPSEKAAISALTEIVRTGNREIREDQAQVIQIQLDKISTEDLEERWKKKKESEEE
jgi:guanylate kinase